MMRSRSDGSQKTRLITSVCIVGIVLGFLYFFVGRDGSQSSGANALRKIGSSYLGGDEDVDTTESTNVQEYVDDNVTPKSYPVSTTLTIKPNVLLSSLLSYSSVSYCLLYVFGFQGM